MLIRLTWQYGKRVLYLETGLFSPKCNHFHLRKSIRISKLNPKIKMLLPSSKLTPYIYTYTYKNMVYITQVPSPNIMPQYPRISQVTHLIVDVSGLTSKVKYVCNTVKVVVLLDDIINIVRTPRKWTRPMDGAPASVRYKTRTASPMGFVVLETIGP